MFAKGINLVDRSWVSKGVGVGIKGKVLARAIRGSLTPCIGGGGMSWKENKENKHRCKSTGAR